ncbi:MAG: ABC transporter permease [Methanobacteriaceae archaeon]|nr:ABC transporter permease [Methanobacteriaceae archaeon]
MSFLKLIFTNPFRSKSRALLAIIGIGIGIATIVALGAVTDGMIASADDTLHAGGSDFTISGKTNNDSSEMMTFGTTTFDESYIDKINNVSGINKTVPIYMGILSTQKSPFLTLIGMDPKEQNMAEITITSGRMYKNDTNEIIMGKVSAETEEKGVGDTITLKGKEFKIVGLFESGNSFQDGGTFGSLKVVQDLMDDEGQISSIYVKVNSGEDAKVVKDRVDAQYGDNLTTISSLTDLEMVKNLIDMLNGASWAISLLAIIIGAVGIINTMLTSVFERTRELGVLKAVGWSNNRIILMIVGESIVITVVAGIIGSIVGVVGIELLAATGAIEMLTPVYTVWTFAKAFAVAIIVGIIGGVYPAYKATRLPATEALRYE